MPREKIETTGELRSYLCKIMTDIEDGKIDLDKAAGITKMAGQINASFYTEVRAASVRAQAGATISKLGTMTIAEEK